MPSWLVEDPTLAFVFLALVALVLGVLWRQTRQRKYLLGEVVVTGLVIVVALLSRYVETDNKRIIHSIEEMAEGVRTHNMDRIFAQIADSFHYGTLDKKGFRSSAERVIRNRDVTEMVVWDFELADVSREKRSGKVTFRAKPRGNFGGDAAYYLVEADYVLDPDNHWRMRSFKVFNPFVETRQPMVIPGVQ